MPGPTGDEREAIIRAIADTEKVIARVAEEQAEREHPRAELRTRLAERNAPIPRSAALVASPTMRPDTKVELFLSLFRGRTDVYPTRFVRKRDGQAGYAPDCRNKFVKDVCDWRR